MFMKRLNPCTSLTTSKKLRLTDNVSPHSIKTYNDHIIELLDKNSKQQTYTDPNTYKKIEDFIHIIQENKSQLNDFPLLHLAIKQKNDDITSILIDLIKTYNVELLNQKDKDGNTALHMAVIYFNHNATDKLCAAGIKLTILNKQDWSPLMLAIKEENLEAVKLLSDYKAQDKYNSIDTVSISLDLNSLAEQKVLLFRAQDQYDSIDTAYISLELNRLAEQKVLLLNILSILTGYPVRIQWETAEDLSINEIESKFKDLQQQWGLSENFISRIAHQSKDKKGYAIKQFIVTDDGQKVFQTIATFGKKLTFPSIATMFQYAGNGVLDGLLEFFDILFYKDAITQKYIEDPNGNLILKMEINTVLEHLSFSPIANICHGYRERLNILKTICNIIQPDNQINIEKLNNLSQELTTKYNISLEKSTKLAKKIAQKFKVEDCNTHPNNDNINAEVNSAHPDLNEKRVGAVEKIVKELSGAGGNDDDIIPELPLLIDLSCVGESNYSE